MSIRFIPRLAWAAALLVIATGVTQAAERLKPYVLASATPGDFAETVKATQTKLRDAGFRIIGEYQPFGDNRVLIATSPELLKAAKASENGGFGAVQRVSVSKVGDQVQVAYANPLYVAQAYRLTDDLSDVAGKLERVLGKQDTFGAKRGLFPDELRNYNYTFGMEYFDEPYELAKYRSHASAVAEVEKNLASNEVGVRQLYKLEIPGTKQVIYGVSMKAPDPESNDRYMDDKFQMTVVDHGAYSAIAYLPYEIMVKDNEVIALHMRFRMAVNFPSLRMAGKNSFFSISQSPEIIQKALTLAVGGTYTPLNQEW
jgi:hypothetical protein